MRLPLPPLVAFCTLLGFASGAHADDDDESFVATTMDGLTSADRTKTHLDSSTTGLWLSALPEVGVVARDPVLAFAVGVGFEHPLFALHLRAPVVVRPLDLGPSDVHPLSPTPCLILRCAEWVSHDTGQPHVESLVRLIDDGRVGHAGDIFHLRLAPMRARMGQGALVDGMMTAPMWDDRRIGAFVDTGFPSGALRAAGFIGDVTRAADLSAMALTLRPLSFFPGSDDEMLMRFLARGELRAEVAADLGVKSGFPTEVFDGQTPTVDPLAGSAATLSWALFESHFFVDVTPFVGGSVLYGLSPTGGAPVPGGGAFAGTSLGIQLPYVGLSTSIQANASTPGHRHGVFGPLYLVERDTALVGVSKGSLRDVPAPGGFGGVFDVEAAVSDVVRGGFRLRLDPTTAGSTAEAFLEASFWGARLSSRTVTRGVPLTLTGGVPRNVSVDTFADLAIRQSYASLELAIPIYGPFSFSARATYAPRVVAPGRIRFDPDILVGISSDMVMASPVFAWF